jgi:hypothetical protein
MQHIKEEWNKIIEILKKIKLKFWKWKIQGVKTNKQTNKQKNLSWTPAKRMEQVENGVPKIKDKA